MVSWRSLFVVGVGLYLAITFGLSAWHASQRIRDVKACPSAERRPDCVTLTPEVASPLASRNLATGEAFAAQTAELELDHDLRYAAVGLAGLVTGLGAALIRLKRPRRLASVLDFWLAFEGLMTVFSSQILLVGAYVLIENSPTGAPLTLDRLGDSLFRALSMIFALVGAS